MQVFGGVLTTEFYLKFLYGIKSSDIQVCLILRNILRFVECNIYNFTKVSLWSLYVTSSHLQSTSLRVRYVSHTIFAGTNTVGSYVLVSVTSSLRCDAANTCEVLEVDL